MDGKQSQIEAAVQSVLDELAGKGLIAGAFGSLYNFLNLVVFYSVTEYFDACESEPADSTRRAQSRALFNAVVALDSAADYLFHAEQRQEPDTLAFLKNLNEPALLEIREIANAVKHCVRRKPQHLQAAQVARPNLHAVVDATAEVNVQLRFSVQFFEAARPNIERAWQFWFDKSREIEQAFAR